MQEKGFQRFSEKQRQLQEQAERRFSINDNEAPDIEDAYQAESLQRYINRKPQSSFSSQFVATFIRRLQCYIGSSKEIFVSLTPLMLPLVYIIVLVMILD